LTLPFTRVLTDSSGLRCLCTGCRTAQRHRSKLPISLSFAESIEITGVAITSETVKLEELTPFASVTFTPNAARQPVGVPETNRASEAEPTGSAPDVSAYV